MTVITRLFLTALTVLALLSTFGGCGRETDFLTHVKQEVSLAHHYVHPLKEMQGNNKVDILFVVDNSASMGSSQANLKKNADLFMDEFVRHSLLDWRIGLVSTDLTNRPFIGMAATDLLDKSRKDPVKAFQTAVDDLGIDGSGLEKPFAAAIKGLTDYPSFMRPGAALAIILITDASEQSGIDGKTFLSQVQALQPPRGSLYVYAVLANSDFGCPPSGETDYDFATSSYAVAINDTKGKYYKLCEDFGPSLADLSADLVTRVSRPFIQLKSRPYLKTVKVLYNGRELKGGPIDQGGYWVYDFDLNRVVFHSLDFAPGENEQVTIEYEGHIAQSQSDK